MSEINLEFTVYFDNDEALEFATKGFELLAEQNFEQAETHFKSKDIDLNIRGGHPCWSFEGLDIEGSLCEGFIIAHEHCFLDRLEFFEKLLELNSDVLIGKVIDDIGRRKSIAFFKGKKTSIAKAKRELIAKVPAFELKDALENDNAEKVDELIKKGVKLRLDTDGSPPIIYSYRTGKMACMKLLAMTGADINATDSEGNTVLMMVARDNLYYGYIKDLLEAGADPNIKNNNNETALGFACVSGDIKKIKLLLEAGADPNVVDIFGNSVVNIAVKNTDIFNMKFLSMLVEAGLKLPETDPRCNTPLITVVKEKLYLIGSEKEPAKRKRQFKKIKEIVRFLIDSGDDINALSTDGGNLLAYALGAAELADYVRSLGVTEIKYPSDQYNEESIEEDIAKAIRFTKLSELEKLVYVAKQANPDIIYEAKYLADAIKTMNPHVVKKLVELGFDSSRYPEQDEEDKRLFEMAEEYRVPEITEILCNAAGDYEAKEAAIAEQVRATLLEIQNDALQIEDEDDIDDTIYDKYRSDENLYKNYDFNSRVIRELRKDSAKDLIPTANIKVITPSYVEATVHVPTYLSKLFLRKENDKWKLFYF